MRVTLAGTKITSYPWGNYNLTPYYLAAYAKKHLDAEFNIFEIPFSLNDPEIPEKYISNLLTNDPEVTGFSCYCWDVREILKLCRSIKKSSPETRVIIGGPSASTVPADILKENPWVDAIAAGEGEETFHAYLKAVQRGSDLKDVAGIFFREKDKVIKTKDRLLIRDLSSIASPYLDGIFRIPGQDIVFEFSRGCVNRCNYCQWKNQSGSGVRYKNIRQISEELEYAGNNGIRFAYIVDSALNYNEKWMKSLFNAIKEHIPSGSMSFNYNLHPQYYSESQIKILEKAALNDGICIAVESINPDPVRLSGRNPLDLKLFEKIIDQVSHAGKIYVLTILGMPSDTLEGFKRTMDYLFSLVYAPDGRRRIEYITPSWMIVDKGTFFDRKKQEFGIITAEKGAPYVLGCSSFKKEEIAEAINYLFTHPMREFIAWMDADPAKYLNAL
jgi:anaerobic magnesium-protoporphyrin IX monomethyl ester cyclase